MAMGLMEAIWHLTDREAPRGDIGRLSDEDIALSIGYSKDEAELINALVSAGWIDRDEKHRLVVHDWHEHAQDSVHMRLARARQHFFNGQAPNLSRLPKDERTAAELFYSSCANSAQPVRTDSPRQAHEVNTASANSGHGVSVPNLTKPLPNQARPEPEPSARAERPARGNVTPFPSAMQFEPTPDECDEFSDWAEAAYRRHPKKKNKPLAMLALKNRFAGDRAAREVFDRNHKLWCDTKEWQERNGAFVPPLCDNDGTGFINDDGWKYPPSSATRASPGANMREELERLKQQRLVGEQAKAKD